MSARYSKSRARCSHRTETPRRECRLSGPGSVFDRITRARLAGLPTTFLKRTCKRCNLGTQFDQAVVALRVAATFDLFQRVPRIKIPTGRRLIAAELCSPFRFNAILLDQSARPVRAICQHEVLTFPINVFRDRHVIVAIIWLSDRTPLSNNRV